MTWQWVVIIVAFLASIGWESYIRMLKERTAIAARSLTLSRDGLTAVLPDMDDARPRNGSS